MTDQLPGRLAQHPTVRKVQSRRTQKPGVLDADWLREICLAAGVDDVAFASVDNPDLASEVEHVEAALPATESYISLVVKMNRDNVRSTARSSPTRSSTAAVSCSTRRPTAPYAGCRTPVTGR
jgi:hypothetical protein